MRVPEWGICARPVRGGRRLSTLSLSGVRLCALAVAAGLALQELGAPCAAPTALGASWVLVQNKCQCLRGCPFCFPLLRPHGGRRRTTYVERASCNAVWFGIVLTIWVLCVRSRDWL